MLLIEMEQKSPREIDAMARGPYVSGIETLRNDTQFTIRMVIRQRIRFNYSERPLQQRSKGHFHAIAKAGP